MVEAAKSEVPDAERTRRAPTVKQCTVIVEHLTFMFPEGLLCEADPESVFATQLRQDAKNRTFYFPNRSARTFRIISDMIMMDKERLADYISTLPQEVKPDLRRDLEFYGLYNFLKPVTIIRDTLLNKYGDIKHSSDDRFAKIVFSNTWLSEVSDPTVRFSPVQFIELDFRGAKIIPSQIRQRIPDRHFRQNGIRVSVDVMAPKDEHDPSVPSKNSLLDTEDWFVIGGASHETFKGAELVIDIDTPPEAYTRLRIEYICTGSCFLSTDIDSVSVYGKAFITI